jgi:prepilin-type N-terminal cleavage/methylation domain-containing protein
MPCTAPRARAGFTLVEMLAATVVLALLTTMVATGVSVGMRVWRSSSFSSTSQLLSSNVEVALSDPIHFSKPQLDNVTGTWDYKVDYRNVAIDKVRLVAHDLGDGTSVLAFQSADDDATYYDLLNEGAYGDLTVANVSMRTTPAASQDNVPPDSVTVRFTLRDKTDPTLTKDFEFTYTPLDSTRS